MARILLFLLPVFTWLGCTHKSVPEKLGDKQVAIFDSLAVYFDPALKDLKLNTSTDSILRLDAGRVILKKITLPDYELSADVKLNVLLTSNGDPWDKSGSFFLLPIDSDFSLIDFEVGKVNLKDMEQPFPAVKYVKNGDQNYYPPLELMRFMTPFGVGYFSNDERTLAQKPIYLTKYDTLVKWSADISHLLPVLKKEVYVGVYIDTWTKEGYTLSADIHFKEFPYALANEKKKDNAVISLVNTIKYAADQRNFDGFYEDSLCVDFYLDSSLSNAKLYYTSTGHGGHATGDEFTKHQNHIFIDQKIVSSFTPWRDDCYQFRGLNPSSGVWYDTVRYKGKLIEERIASSDFSRSNWCPGSNVEPLSISLGELNMGKHQLKIKIPTAQKAKKGEDNYWMVSAYIVGE